MSDKKDCDWQDKTPSGMSYGDAYGRGWRCHSCGEYEFYETEKPKYCARDKKWKSKVMKFLANLIK